MTVKEYLVSLGFDDATATSMSADANTSRAVEAAITQYNEGIAARTAAEETAANARKMQTDLDTWWKTEAQPAILGADGGSAAAKAEAAQYRTYIKSLKDQGYPVPDEWLKEGSTVTPAAPPASPAPARSSTPAFDPSAFALDQANAMTMLYDLGNEYQELYGTPMPNANGLFQEARQQNKSLRDYVRGKFNFDTKRTELAAKKEADRVAAITKDITEKLQAKYAAERSNPMLAPAVSSRAAEVREANKEKSDAWKTKQGREEAKRERLEKFRNVVAMGQQKAG